MYNVHGRGMRLLSHPILFGCMALTSVLPNGHWGVAALTLVEFVAIWATLPDMHFLARQGKCWCCREFGGFW